MSPPIVLRAEAEAEFDEAFDWYEARRAGLGVVFANEIQIVFDAIALSPKMHGVVLGDVRKAVVRRFPFCVFYRAHPNQIEVVAVFHTSRDPSDWQGRVSP
ncbi:MAG: type II toxin-antitoxin system RelE/ParE family toxin [Planctomycetes bacterium]|nr:type II toxin-antitoxin system RelE/ParE family toxin [Planctomycetota bacterium]